VTAGGVGLVSRLLSRYRQRAVRSGMRSNQSFDADPRPYGAPWRVDEPAPCGMVPVRAGQLRR
jgi:hypothetical protein